MKGWYDESYQYVDLWKVLEVIGDKKKRFEIIEKVQCSPAAFLKFGDYRSCQSVQKNYDATGYRPALDHAKIAFFEIEILGCFCFDSSERLSYVVKKLDDGKPKQTVLKTQELLDLAKEIAKARNLNYDTCMKKIAKKIKLNI